MESLNSVFTVLKVALGLGFVVFVHELGHFLLAKWNGVKVEKFSIGFGPTIFGFTRGETEYVLAALPLGGFVKMLGEGQEETETRSTDPRAYPNKSVGSRMAIISAGVIMNLFLAVFCFAYHNGQERDELAATLGLIAAGSPAYNAGLRPGDEVVAIDDRPDPSYASLRLKVLLSGNGDKIHLRVKRPGQQGLIDLDIQPRREPTADAPTIGILQGDSLNVFDFQAPAGMVAPPAFSPLELSDRASKADVLVAAGPVGQAPTPLATSLEYKRLLAQHPDQPIVHVIERQSLKSTETGPAPQRTELTLPPNHFVDFGMRLAMEPISGIRKDSPAEEAGFRVGDRILKVNDLNVNDQDDLDPLKLPARCFQSAGKPMRFQVERAVASGEKKTLTLTVTPDDTPYRTGLALPNEAVDIPGLGLCYPIRNRITAVRPDSPAARAGLKPGDTINSMTLTPPKKPDVPVKGRVNRPTADRPETITFDDQNPGWYSAFFNLQTRPIQEVELVVNRATKPVKITPGIDPEWLNPDRGLRFQVLIRKRAAQDIVASLVSGYHETIDNIAQVYATFRSLATKRVSPKNLGGPILIAQVAYSAAGSGFTDLVLFLGILSVNLAVLNFLPIPPLDGGQMAFLVAEGVRGRPLPDSALIAGTYLGLLLVLCLMLFVTYQDVFRLFNWL